MVGKMLGGQAACRLIIYRARQMPIRLRRAGDKIASLTVNISPSRKKSTARAVDLPIN